MKVRTRFIRSVIETAKTDATPMPWSRGVAREVAVMARRSPVAARVALPNIRIA